VGGDDVLADLHATRGNPDATLDTIIEWARGAVDSTDAGIFLIRGKGKIETVVPTSPTVSKAHDRQIELGEGPCIEVLHEDDSGTYIIGDTASDRRFPTWGPEAADLGLRSVISAALDTRQKRLGSLNIFSSEPHAFDLDDLAVIDIFSRRAARALAVAEEKVGLTAALDTRKLIGQAQGILMERFDIDGDRAFEVLIRESQTRNVKLRAIAEWLVEHRSDKSLNDLDL
jgi:GAF domain-containing protein